LKSPIILRIFKGNQLIEVKQFEADQVIFGHNAEVTVDLDDPSISAIHCLIELRDSGYYLCDMGSSSGTKKNGHPVLDEAISSGDNIEVGPFRIQFFVGAPKPKVPPAEAPAAVPTAVPPAPPAAAPVKPATPPTPPAAAIPPTPAAPVAPPPKAKVPAPAFVPPAPPPTAQPVTPSAKPPKLPEAAKAGAESFGHKKSKSNEGTYAPASEIQNLQDYLKPTKGPVVEVIVAWQERILATYHYGGDQNVTIGSSPKADIAIPGSFIKGIVPFLELKGGCRVLTTVEMDVSLINSSQGKFALDEMMKNGKALKAGAANAIRLDQGELLCLSLDDGAIQIYVRYVANTIKPVLATPLDFSAGELTGLIVALVIVSLTALYMSVYTPTPPDAKEEEQVRLAQFIYNKPPPTTPPPPEPTMPPVKKEVEVKPPPPPPEPVKVKVTDEKKEAVQKGKKDSVAAVKQKEAAKASEVRPNPSKVDRPKKFTSIKHGGATKIGETAGANAKSAKDVSKVGLLSAFGGGGVRKELDQAYSGSGELLGMANQATGKSGQNESREGDDIGSKIKDTGAGGKGTATQGIAGIGTKGRGGGSSTYGSGIGLGGKGNVTIDAGGADEGWEGTIDREAVRRVIRSILNQIKSCYERELRVKKGLEGKVVIQFEIMEQGRVRSAKTKNSSMNSATVESCVAARIREARFPEPPAGTIAVVDYPFVFGAQE
jgi:TonB family protein